MRSFILVISLLIAIPIYAQKNNFDTIKTYKNQYFLNSQRINRWKLRPHLMGYATSASEFKSFTKYSTIGTPFLLVSLTFGVIAFTKINDGPFFNKYTITQFSSGLIGVIFMEIAKRHLKKSIKNYNREVSTAL